MLQGGEVPHLVEDLGHRALVPPLGVGRQAVELGVRAGERYDAGAAALAGEAEDEGEEGGEDEEIPDWKRKLMQLTDEEA